jgi:hypothetical protein
LLYKDIEDGKSRRVLYTLIFTAGKVLVILFIIESVIEPHSADEWISGTLHVANDTYCLQCLAKSWLYTIPIYIITAISDKLIYEEFRLFNILSLVIIFLVWKILSRSYPLVLDFDFIKNNIFYLIGLLATMIFRMTVKVD